MTKGITFDNNLGPVTILNESEEPRHSILGRLIEIIAVANCDKMDLDRMPADIEEKIHFNNLKRYHWLEDYFVSYSLLIDESIRELNQTILNGSTKLKRQMKIFYYKSLSKFAISTKPFDIEKLRLHSDSVVEDVILQVTTFVRSSADLKSGYFKEDIDHGVALVTSYSIIECIVLENPNDHD